MRSTTIGGATGAAVHDPARARVNWKEIILFVVLAYGLAWAWSGYFLLPYLGDLLIQSATPIDMLARLGAGRPCRPCSPR
jgi:hypothetical protein